jgi:hypothetical protein
MGAASEGQAAKKFIKRFVFILCQGHIQRHSNRVKETWLSFKVAHFAFSSKPIPSHESKGGHAGQHNRQKLTPDSSPYPIEISAKQINIDNN